MPERSPLHDYRWHPDAGPDERSLQRMQTQFSRPAAPMGEAWFLGEKRRMFLALMDEDPERWADKELSDAWGELASGPSSFGHRQEWSDWFRYLLPRTVPRIGPWAPVDLYSTMVSAVFIHCPPEDFEDDDPGFRIDVLDTLGKGLLGTRLWRAAHPLPNTALATIEHTVCGWEFSAGGAFSAAMFLVARYLDLAALDGWMRSVAAFEDIFWRAKWVVWLFKGQRLLLRSGMQPADLPEDWNGARWDESWSLKGSAPCRDVDPTATVRPFLDPLRQQALGEAVRQTLTQQMLARWRDEICAVQDREGQDLGLALLQYDEAARSVVSAYRLA